MPDVVTASEDYASRFYGEVGAWFLKVQESAVRDFIGEDRSISILDVGGGHIQLAGPLSEAGFSFTVHGSAESCRERMDANPSTRNCEFLLSSPTALPVGDRSFHTVLSFRLFAHYEEWRTLVAELCRVADHSIIIDLPSKSALNLFGPLLFKLKRRIEKNTRHWESYRVPEVVDVFRECGFRVEAQFKEFLLPMVFYRILRSRRLAAGFEAAFRLLHLTQWFGSPVILKLTREEA
jgi:2-polyprenyl-3-methyl-5-hydroxy-6-metoxy-1,4-benzoquinol methylase